MHLAIVLGIKNHWYKGHINIVYDCLCMRMQTIITGSRLLRDLITSDLLKSLESKNSLKEVFVHAKDRDGIPYPDCIQEQMQYQYNSAKAYRK